MIVILILVGLFVMSLILFVSLAFWACKVLHIDSLELLKQQESPEDRSYYVTERYEHTSELLKWSLLREVRAIKERQGTPNEIVEKEIANLRSIIDSNSFEMKTQFVLSFPWHIRVIHTFSSNSTSTTYKTDKLTLRPAIEACKIQLAYRILNH